MQPESTVNRYRTLPVKVKKQEKHVETLPLDPDRQGEAGDDSSAFSSCLFATRVKRPSKAIKKKVEL
jgi:hypothetical protein